MLVRPSGVGLGWTVVGEEGPAVPGSGDPGVAPMALRGGASSEATPQEGLRLLAFLSGVTGRKQGDTTPPTVAVE